MQSNCKTRFIMLLLWNQFLNLLIDSRFDDDDDDDEKILSWPITTAVIINMLVKSTTPGSVIVWRCLIRRFYWILMFILLAFSFIHLFIGNVPTIWLIGKQTVLKMNCLLLQCKRMYTHVYTSMRTRALKSIRMRKHSQPLFPNNGFYYSFDLLDFFRHFFYLLNDAIFMKNFIQFLLFLILFVFFISFYFY